jgi:hypothetical protein
MQVDIRQRPPDLIKSTGLVNHARLVNILQRPPDLIKPIRLVIFARPVDFARPVNIAQSLLSYKALSHLVTI